MDLDSKMLADHPLRINRQKA